MSLVTPRARFSIDARPYLHFQAADRDIVALLRIVDLHEHRDRLSHLMSWAIEDPRPFQLLP